MFEGEEQINSGESTEAAPEPQETSAESGASAEKSAAATKPEQDTQENVPFHKHPRWIERDNELKAEREARQRLEQQYQDMGRRLQDLSQPKSTQPDKRAAMLERLGKIDPEFAEFVGGLAPTKELEELRAWKQEQQVQSERQKAYGELERLHGEHKVPADLKPRYNAAIEAAIRANPQARLEDLPKIFKSVHDDYSSWIDSIKRAERESYVKAKTKDAAVPGSQPKGTPAKPAKGSEWSKDPDEARAQLIQRVVSKSRASNDI